MHYQIILYKNQSGHEPVVDFLHLLPAKHRAKAIKTIDLLAEFGRDLREPYAKHIEDEL